MLVLRSIAMNESQPTAIDYATPDAKFRVNTLAIVAFSISLIGFVVPFVGLIALFFSLASRRQLAADPHQRGRTAARVAIVAGVLGTFASSAMVWIYCLRIAEQRMARCERQMRVIGDCIALYVVEHRGQFPPSLSALAHQTDIGGTEIFTCPSSGSVSVRTNLTDEIAARKSRQIDYAYLGEGLDSRSPPSEIVLMERLLDHSPRVNVLYANGATRTITISQALTALEALRNTPRLTDEEHDFIVGK